MPSTSTGYGKQTIYKEQYSSGGQLMGFSSGCKLNMKIGSEIEMESGSTFNVEAGAYISLNTSGSVLYEKVIKYSTATHVVKGAIKAIPPSGFAYISGFSTKTNSNSTALRMWLASPPKAGIRKTILVRNTTRILEICASSSKVVEFGTSGGKDYSLVMAPTTKSKDAGVMVNLVSISSKLWHVSVGGAAVARSTNNTNTGLVTLTSSTCKNV